MQDILKEHEYDPNFSFQIFRWKKNWKKCSTLNKRGIYNNKRISSTKCSMSTNYHASCIKNVMCHGLSLSMAQHEWSKILCLLTLGWHIVLISSARWHGNQFILSFAQLYVSLNGDNSFSNYNYLSLNLLWSKLLLWIPTVRSKLIFQKNSNSQSSKAVTK